MSGSYSKYGEMLNAYMLVGDSKGKNNSKFLGIDCMITVQWISGQHGGKVWIRLIWHRIRTSGGLL